jgi:Domain of unknown function (DUF5666)
MNRYTYLRAPVCSILAAVLIVVFIVSCGGGGVVGSAGTGRTTGVTQGTVNGFGSVIVDGLSYDDRNAPVVAEAAPGVNVPAAVKLGHRVSVDREVSGVASTVRVEAALAGPVASIASPTQFSMLGQLVTVNSNGMVGPITQFGGGYAAAADVRAGDAIEVHGLLVRQSTSYVIQATRIDKLAAAPAYLRVSGLVSALGAAGSATLSLGALAVDTSGATVLPAGAALADGQAVTVLALPGTLSMPTSGTWRLQAAQLRIQKLPEGGDDYVSGSVSHLDAQAKTFTLGGLLVNYANATLTPATTTVLANGQYVQARGVTAADGSLVATALAIRDAGSDTEAELKGNVSRYDAATKRFEVRGVQVDGSSASVQGCPASGLADGVFVEVEGAVGSTGVIASQIHCEAEPGDATLEREGVAGSVDLAAKRFTITRQGTVTTAAWTDATFFSGGTPQAMSGKEVHALGPLVGGVLTASRIEIEH